MRKGSCPYRANPTGRNETARCAMDAMSSRRVPYGRARLAALRNRAVLWSKSIEYEIQSGTRVHERMGSAVPLHLERTVSIHLMQRRGSCDERNAIGARNK